MNGIDISKWNPIDLSKVECDFVIVKATQGTGYVSSLFTQQITQAISLGKLIGVYHYASSGGAIAEAEHFLKTVKSYIGKAILVLDWEGEQNPNFGNPEYAKAWLQYVKDATGITPFIYMSKSVCRQYKNSWNPAFPLWCAQYKNNNPTGYQENPWTDSKGFGPWNGCKILQYSSKGRLEGYPNNLDLDKSYMDKDEWLNWASGDLLPEPIELSQTEIRPVLRKGDHNKYVESLQIYLNANGFNCGKVDGWFGDMTEDAVIALQQAHGMESGFVGEQTWSFIL